jgi:hypothetical protein
MALIFDLPGEERMQLDEFVERALGCIDPDDPDSILGLAPDLAALARNKKFVLEYIHKDLKEGIENFQLYNQYTDQSLILERNKRFTIRLNIWSPPVPYGGDVKWDEKRHSYNLAHNHNFDLLTVGYWGPGYLTDLYEFDFENALGYVGEKIPLEARGRAQLSQNRGMFYRKNVDVHTQLSPAELSMSLNLIPNSSGAGNIDQYEFDVEKKIISAHVGGSVTQRASFLHLTSLIGDENTLQLLIDIAQAHTNPRIRAQAFIAAAKLSKENVQTILEIAARDEHELVRMEARRIDR